MLRSMAILSVLVLFAVLAAVASFQYGGLNTGRVLTRLWKNKIDNIQIDGDLTPLSNNLLVRVKEVASQSQGGLFIPDNAKERPTEGTVIAAGPGRQHPETGQLNQ